MSVCSLLRAGPDSNELQVYLANRAEKDGHDLPQQLRHGQYDYDTHTRTRTHIHTHTHTHTRAGKRVQTYIFTKVCHLARQDTPTANLTVVSVHAFFFCFLL